MNHVEESIEHCAGEGLRNSLTSVNIDSRVGVFRETLLQKTVEKCWVQGILILLENNADVEACNSYGQTALHYAVSSKSIEIVRLLLEKGNETLIHRRDYRGHSALHDAAKFGVGDIVKELLESGAAVNEINSNGLTPLHLSLESRDVTCIQCLIKAGADIQAKDNKGRTILSVMLTSYQDIFMAVMDECFLESEDKLLNETRINIYFYLFTNNNCDVLSVIKDILDSGSLKLISHPLCETFLLLQWLKLRRYFIAEVIMYFMFTVLSTILILNKYVWSQFEEYFPNIVEEFFCQVSMSVVIIGAVFMLLRQCFIVIHGIKLKMVTVWYVLNFAVPVLVLIVMLPTKYSPWQGHVSAITLLLSWCQGMLHIGRFPKWGIYITMFTSVAKNLMRTFMIFLCVFIAFTLAFTLIYFSGNPVLDPSTNETIASTSEQLENNINDLIYSNVLLTFIKTLTMMIGEVGFDENLIEVLAHLPITAHFIYVAFIFLISILLSNLLVALAVSDVQGLRSKANVEKLFKQAELAELMKTTCQVISTVFKIVTFKRISLDLYGPSLLSSDSRVYLNIDNHNTSGYLVVRQSKRNVKVASMSQQYISDVQQSLMNTRTKADTEHATCNELRKILEELRNDVISLTDKISEISTRICGLEKKLISFR